MNGDLGSTEVMHSRDKAVYISKGEAGVAHYRADIKDTLRSFTERGRSGITLGRDCYTIAATSSCRRRTARGWLPVECSEDRCGRARGEGSSGA